MNDDQLLRYSRQIFLPQIDIAGQEQIIAAHALVVGVGGLGSPVAQYLAAAGVGKLTLVDDDCVELSNLQRQVIHTEASIGQNKAQSAAQAIKQLNHTVTVITHDKRLSDVTLIQQVRSADVVIDCSDNFTTRTAINIACYKTKTPLVSGAAIRFEGQLSVFDFTQLGQACYACIYPVANDNALNCAQSGILSPVVGVIGTHQALEAIKVICHIPSKLAHKLGVFDGMAGTWRYINLKADPHCAVCSAST